MFADVIKNLETRSSRITRGALNPKPSALEATEETQTGQWALEDTGGERSSSATSQGASQAQELAEAFPGPAEGAQPCWDLDFGPLASRALRIPMVLSQSAGARCYAAAPGSSESGLHSPSVSALSYACQSSSSTRRRLSHPQTRHHAGLLAARCYLPTSQVAFTAFQARSPTSPYC